LPFRHKTLFYAALSAQFKFVHDSYILKLPKNQLDDPWKRSRYLFYELKFKLKFAKIYRWIWNKRENLYTRGRKLWQVLCLVFGWTGSYHGFGKSQKDLICLIESHLFLPRKYTDFFLTACNYFKWKKPLSKTIGSSYRVNFLFENERFFLLIKIWRAKI